MKVRYKSTLQETFATEFNVTTVGEVITMEDSVFITDLEVFLKSTNVWKDMAQAFQDKDLIPDNANTRFAEPKTPEDKERGYFL